MALMGGACLVAQPLVACVRPGDSKHCFVFFVAVSPIIIGVGGLLGHRIELSCGCDDLLNDGCCSLVEHV